jgi:hypothetical protein
MATNNDVDASRRVYFYKDTINTGKIKMCCVFEGFYKMYFTTLITFHFTAQPMGKGLNVQGERRLAAEDLFSRKYICTIQIDHNARSVYYQYEDDFQQDFRSVPDFLQACIDELSKEKIIIKMGALYETVYRPYTINRLSAELYGRWDYRVLKEHKYVVE